MKTTFIPITSLQEAQTPQDAHATLRQHVLFLLQKITQFNLQQRLPALTATELIHHQILLLLLHEELPMSTPEVATQLRISATVLKAVLHDLQQDGYVILDPFTSENGLLLTPHGRAAAERLSSWPQLITTFTKVASARALEELLLATVHILSTRQHTIPIERMCITCQYFIPFHTPRDPIQPHYCLLVDAPLLDSTLRLYCPEHRVPASQ